MREIDDMKANIILRRQTVTRNVLGNVEAERARQDRKWGGPTHDDKHSVADFCRWINNYAGWADQMADAQSYDKARRRLIQAAALAVAAVESLDRKHG